jgi:hypothetical protein
MIPRRVLDHGRVDMNDENDSNAVKPQAHSASAEETELGSQRANATNLRSKLTLATALGKHSGGSGVAGGVSMLAALV